MACDSALSVPVSHSLSQSYYTVNHKALASSLQYDLACPDVSEANEGHVFEKTLTGDIVSLVHRLLFSPSFRLTSSIPSSFARCRKQNHPPHHDASLPLSVLSLCWNWQKIHHTSHPPDTPTHPTPPSSPSFTSYSPFRL